MHDSLKAMRRTFRMKRLVALGLPLFVMFIATAGLAKKH
jgi:hypothetical protein